MQDASSTGAGDRSWRHAPRDERDPALFAVARWEDAVAIEITEREMTSDITPEYAFRVYGMGSAVWRLTWLPDHRLTPEQARAGMELDELLSDPEVVYDGVAHALAADLARRLGILVEHAVLMLACRMAERIEGSDTRTTTPTALPEPVLSGWSAQHLPAVSGARSQRRWM